jgi:hypothetical protein
MAAHGWYIVPIEAFMKFDQMNISQPLFDTRSLAPLQLGWLSPSGEKVTGLAGS